MITHYEKLTLVTNMIGITNHNLNLKIKLHKIEEIPNNVLNNPIRGKVKLDNHLYDFETIIRKNKLTQPVGVFSIPSKDINYHAKLVNANIEISEEADD